MAASLLDIDPEDWPEAIAAIGGKAFHGKIVRQAVFEQGLREYEEMTSLPADLRSTLAEEFPIYAGEALDEHVAPDGTTKLLTHFERPGSSVVGNGDAVKKRSDNAVETVYIPSLKSTKGATLCVSSQIGCPVACPFCASGLLGLSRNLEQSEIVEQYLRGAECGPLSRSVVMGIGEPLLNFANLRGALDIVQKYMGLGSRSITVSTVGFPDRLRRIAPTQPPFQLAISLHTPFDEQRDELVPAMRGVPIEEVLSAGDDWFEKTGREITYEYVLLAGENDSELHADTLADRLLGRRATINLIPFNPVDESRYGRPDAFSVTEFQRSLTRAGLVATVRWSRGLDASAACGQLRIRSSQ